MFGKCTKIYKDVYYNSVISEGFLEQVNVGHDWCQTSLGVTVMNTPVMSLQMGEKKIVNYLKYIKVFNSHMERKTTPFLTIFYNIHLLMKIFTNENIC